MPTAKNAIKRWRRLAPLLISFPLRCGHCAQFMTDDEELSVVEGLYVPRAVHTSCLPKMRREARELTKQATTTKEA